MAKQAFVTLHAAVFQNFSLRSRTCSEWTPPNSALLVRAGDTGAAHRVIPLKTGERTILKMVWTVPGSAKLDSFYEHIDSLPGLRGKGLKQASAGGNRKGAKGRRQK